MVFDTFKNVYAELICAQQNHFPHSKIETVYEAEVDIYTLFGVAEVKEPYAKEVIDVDSDAVTEKIDKISDIPSYFDNLSTKKKKGKYHTGEKRDSLTASLLATRTDRHC